eukprot:7703940-Pyramimonas_sp.AAC.1
MPLMRCLGFMTIGDTITPYSKKPFYHGGIRFSPDWLRRQTLDSCYKYYAARGGGWLRRKVRL